MSSNLLLKARPSARANWRACLDELSRTLDFSVDACFEALVDHEIYAYLSTAADATTIAPKLERMCAQQLGDAGASANALSALLQKPGPAHGEFAPFHYVVEADVEAEHEEELNAWYNTEHLPGLAAVPGCILATRWRNLSHAPRYIAAYDLLAPDVTEHPAWLAVRNTAWSSRVRPNFRNPKRTMFRRAEQT
jgi:hypothetical protein